MKPFRWLRRGLTLASVGIAGGAAVITARHLLATPQPLENRLFGETHSDRRPEGDVFYNVAGPQDAEPVVLLHDFYPGASNYEYRRVYPRLATDYRVYALDWLGFGLSERPALAYTGEFYAHLLNGFLRETVRRPAVVMAHGLAANVAVRAAADEPALFERLALIEPHPLAGTLPGPTATQTLMRSLQRTSLGLLPYAALSTRAALRWQLARHAMYRGEGAASDDVLDHVYASAHQFGGHHALLALLTGELDMPIENALALLEPPVLIVAGEGDGQRSTAGLQDLTLLNANAALATIAEAGSAVHEDQPAALVERLTAWLRTPQTRSMPHISETRSTARFPAGAIRLSEGISEDAQGSEAPAEAQPGRPEAPAPTSSARESAELLPPGSVAHAMTDDSADESVTEQFGEPHGLVSAHPHLGALEGLAEQAPETGAALDELDELDEPGQARVEAAPDHPNQDTTQIVGKANGDIEDDIEEERTGAVGDTPDVTALSHQPSENTSPSTNPNAPSAASSAAPRTGANSARTPRSSGRANSSKSGSGAASTGRPSTGGRQASGKSGGSGRSAGGPSGSSGSSSSSGRKHSSHRPKKS